MMLRRLEIAEQTAEAAAKAAMSHFREIHLSIASGKRPQEAFTDAYRDTENIIRQRLLHFFPQDTIIGPGEISKHSRSYWAISPIEGIRNFVRGSSLWGISIGYVSDSKPVIGVISHPALDILLSVWGAAIHLNGQVCERRAAAEMFKAVAIGDSPDWDFTHRLCIEKACRDSGWDVVNFHSITTGFTLSVLGYTGGVQACFTSMGDVAAGFALAKAAGLCVRMAGVHEVNMLHVTSGDSELDRRCARLIPYPRLA